MLIDAFDERWLERLNEADYLLIDGAFVPGLFRRFAATGVEVSLLFASLPACSDATRDVSPFLVPWKCGNHRLEALVCECSGNPMVSAISSVETLAELTARLAAWCVVEADGQWFNFRFADTRRLPSIAEALLPAQRSQLFGPASRWSCIGRNGKWRELEMNNDAGPIADRPSFNEQQFARLVGDSEADEVIAMLEYRGTGEPPSRSQRYATVYLALQTAIDADLDFSEKLAWCEFCTLQGSPSNQVDMTLLFEQWAQTHHSTESSNQ